MNKTNAARGLIGAAMAISMAACTSAGVSSNAAPGSGSPVGTAASPASANPSTSQPSTAAKASPPVSASASNTQPAQASAKPAQPAATCSTGTRACPIRITFAKGAYSAQAHGQLSGVNSELWFVVDASANQSMVTVVAGAGATRGVVTFPNGQTEGQPGGRVFDGVLPVSGDYLIRVTESSMGEAWSGRVDVVTLIY